MIRSYMQNSLSVNFGLSLWHY
ncbi:hypothetical protein MTR67_038431 [Solanum verrucosum]|uniref:Uncharacterized protein n=1 Tax=Solanum verrucosum TaxID=315347 RepID=A0AAF0ZMW4_SOLVR|nr:hypothetical protein MTR67_038431 [Solanum verrucosum]